MLSLLNMLKNQHCKGIRWQDTTIKARNTNHQTNWNESTWIAYMVTVRACRKHFPRWTFKRLKQFRRSKMPCNDMIHLAWAESLEKAPIEGSKQLLSDSFWNRTICLNLNIYNPNSTRDSIDTPGKQKSTKWEATGYKGRSRLPKNGGKH